MRSTIGAEAFLFPHRWPWTRSRWEWAPWWPRRADAPAARAAAASSGWPPPGRRRAPSSPPSGSWWPLSGCFCSNLWRRWNSLVFFTGLQNVCRLVMTLRSLTHPHLPKLAGPQFFHHFQGLSGNLPLVLRPGLLGGFGLTGGIEPLTQPICCTCTQNTQSFCFLLCVCVRGRASAFLSL